MKELASVKTSIENADIVFFYNESLLNQPQEKGIDTLLHDHPWYEIQAILEGSITVKVKKNTFKVKENEISFIPPTLYHNTYSDRFSGVKRMVVCFEVQRNKKVDSDFYDIIVNNFSRDFKVLNNRNCMEYLRKLSAILVSKRACKEIRIKSILILFFMELYDEFVVEESLSLQNGAGVAYTDEYIFSRLGTIVSSPLIDNISLEEVSKELFISKKKINSILKEKYNMTYKQKQILSRIENARKYLDETNLKIDEIASIVNYSNITNFYKDFRRIVGCSPKEYRDRRKEEEGTDENSKNKKTD